MAVVRRVPAIRLTIATSTAATTTARAGKLCDELESSLLSAKIGERHPGVGVNDRGEGDAAEVMPFRHHLGPQQDCALGFAEALQRLGQERRTRYDVRVEAEPLQLRDVSGQLS